MTWAEDYRQNWIQETIRVFGFINRAHLQRKFGISLQQASSDLKRFVTERPGVIRYNPNAKQYDAEGAEKRAIELLSLLPEGYAIVPVSGPRNLNWSEDEVLQYERYVRGIQVKDHFKPSIEQVLAKRDRDRDRADEVRAEANRTPDTP